MWELNPLKLKKKITRRYEEKNNKKSPDTITLLNYIQYLITLSFNNRVTHCLIALTPC